MNDDSISVPELVIEDFLPKRGLMLFGGRPKEGKSWFACQLALSFVTGQPLCGWLQVAEPGRVHYWSLEDGLPITKDKLSKLLRGARPDGLRDLKVFDTLPAPILRGGDEALRAALREHSAELIILDSLFRLTGQRQPHGDISQADYDVINRVRQVALEFNCVAVIIMHTRKGSRGGDPIENLLGTSGNTAAADVCCELRRKGRTGTLTVVGRLVERTDFELAWFDSDEWGWGIQGQGEDADLGDTSEDVLTYLEAEGSANPTVIARAIGKSFKSVWNALDRLRTKGRVTRDGKKWRAASR